MGDEDVKAVAAEAGDVVIDGLTPTEEDKFFAILEDVGHIYG